MRRCFAVGMVLLLLLVWSVPGCNTIEGMGKDVLAAGDAIQDAAD